MSNVLRLEPTPKQAAFLQSPAKFTLYGGARGGGKTFAVIIDWLTHSETYGRKARGIVFRRELTELDDFLEEAKDILQAAGHRWMEQKKQFVSHDGAILRCRYLDDDRDAAKYQGHQYTRVYIEEIGGFPNEAPIKKLAATLRSKWGIPCQFKATANPGGAGHTWVKARFISPAPPNTPFSKDSGKTYTVYIPAKLLDNPHLMENDPDYIEMIKASGDSELVRAWLDGDWDVAVGQYFTEFRREKHVIPTVPLPSSWSVRYRAMDWGSSRPYAVVWIAVADGSALPGVDKVIPRGALVVYRELYGIAIDIRSGDEVPNMGTREYASAVGKRIVEAEFSDAIIVKQYTELNKIDPSTFSTNGGPSIAEELAREGAWFSRADNRRTVEGGAHGGWDQIRKRLTGMDGLPHLYIMDCCVHLLRTLPVLPRDPNKLDDVDTDAEDHAADALRYGCMARPYMPPKPVAQQVPVRENQYARNLQEFTMNDVWKCQLLGDSRRISKI